MALNNPPDNLTIRLQPVGWRQPNRPLWACALMVGAVFLMLVAGLLMWIPPLIALFAVLSLIVTGMMIGPLVRSAVWPVYLSVRDGKLTLHGPARRTLTWRRDEIRAIVAHSMGLSIVSREYRPPVLPEREEAELHRAATILQSALNVPGEWPLEPGEVLAICDRVVSEDEDAVRESVPICVRATHDELAMRLPWTPVSERIRILPRGWRAWLPMRGVSLRTDGVQYLPSQEGTLRIKLVPAWPNYCGAYVITGDRATLEPVLRPFLTAFERVASQ